MNWATKRVEKKNGLPGLLELLCFFWSFFSVFLFFFFCYPSLCYCFESGKAPLSVFVCGLLCSPSPVRSSPVCISCPVPPVSSWFFPRHWFFPVFFSLFSPSLLLVRLSLFLFFLGSSLVLFISLYRSVPLCYIVSVFSSLAPSGLLLLSPPFFRVFDLPCLWPFSGFYKARECHAVVAW